MKIILDRLMILFLAGWFINLILFIDNKLIEKIFKKKSELVTNIAEFLFVIFFIAYLVNLIVWSGFVIYESVK